MHIQGAYWKYLLYILGRGGFWIGSCDLFRVLCRCLSASSCQSWLCSSAGNTRDAFDSLTRFVCHRAPHSNRQLCQMLFVGGWGAAGRGAGPRWHQRAWCKAMIALWSKKKQLAKRATIDLNALPSPLGSARGCVT